MDYFEGLNQIPIIKTLLASVTNISVKYLYMGLVYIL